MAKLIATAESDPRKPSMVTPLVVEFEGYHGHVETWNTKSAIPEDHSHLPHTYLTLLVAGKDHPVGLKMMSRRSTPMHMTEFNEVRNTHLSELHVHLSVNEKFKVIWPHYEPGGHG